MRKKRTSKKQSFCLSDITINKIKNYEGLSKVNTTEYFKNEDKVARALLQCLIEGDAEAFMEILDAFLSVNRKRLAQAQNIARSTVQMAFSKKGNPTLKTIAKIVHGTIAQESSHKARN